MRAIQISEWTRSPRALVVRELAPPVPAADECLIRVRASAVTHALALLVAGQYQRKPTLPFVPGNTAAGVVAEVGERVTRFRPGDRVLASIEHGGLAEWAVAPEVNTYCIPPQVAFSQATTFNSSYNSVLAALSWPRLLEIRAGQTLLVTGAAGNIGIAATQIATLLGARVIAAASTPEKRAVSLAEGAFAAVGADPGTLRDAVRAAAGASGVDAAIEPVGGSLFDAALRSLAPGGRILPIGFASGVIPQIPANLVLVKNITVCGLYMGYYKIDARAAHERQVRALFDQLGAWCAEGRIRPRIRAQLPLARAGEAFGHALDRAHCGHVVVDMDT